MRRFQITTSVVLLALTISTANAGTISGQLIFDEAAKVGDAQLAALGDKVQIDWVWGVMDAGYADFADAAPAVDRFAKAMDAVADKVKWTPQLRPKDPFSADDFCLGQMLLARYLAHPDPVHLEPLRKRLDALVEVLNHPKGDKLTFWWCDALFMAPPVLAQMSEITGDSKYIDAMDSEFWRTTKQFYDPQEHLFYRDAHFLKKLDANGKKIFWARGNGWVLGGLARVLRHMPGDYPSRGKYETLFKEMSEKLITLQSKDGTWPPSLIDPKLIPGPEISGTALFTYAMAWGINNKLLPRDVYLPVAARGWNAMLNDRRADGLPGYVQAVGLQPGAVKPDGTHLYATGAYLMAAVELQKLAPLQIENAKPPTTR